MTWVLGVCMGLIAVPGPIKESKASFESGGKTIRVERYAPGASGKHPAVVVLYGSGGILPRGDGIQGISRLLASRGYSAFLPHCFDATGGKPPRGAIDGEAHRQAFTVSCRIDALQRETTGHGSSRRVAEQEAARAALAELAP